MRCIAPTSHSAAPPGMGGCVERQQRHHVTDNPPPCNRLSLEFGKSGGPGKLRTIAPGGEPEKGVERRYEQTPKGLFLGLRGRTRPQKRKTAGATGLLPPHGRSGEPLTYGPSSRCRLRPRCDRGSLRASKEARSTHPATPACRTGWSRSQCPYRPGWSRQRRSPGHHRR